ncbi:MAG: hypothetical protein ACK46Y_13820 [Fluviicola sp.]|jgi:hypothetical protein
MKEHRYDLLYAINSTIYIAAFFILLSLFGMEQNSYLRLVNLLIVFYFSNKLARKNNKENITWTYINGFVSIFTMNVITTIFSIIGFILYVLVVDDLFLTKIDGGLLWPKGLKLPQACSALFLEGISGAIIASFALMYYWKDVKHTAN